MSLNADDVTLNNNVIPPNNNLNVTVEGEAEAQSQRIQSVFLPAVNGPRNVQENINDGDHARNLPTPTDQASKNAPSDDGANLSPSVKENDGGLPGLKKYRKSSRQASKLPSKACTKATTSNRAVIKLWIVVVITLIHCVVLMVAENLTHSLTLRVEAYHSLYNVGVLAGSLLSIKLCQQPESLKNTFGWARIDVVLYLVSLIFLSSLCFSVAVEAAQTALHIHHQDPMHHPEATIFVCFGSLAVNAIVFFLIGGYTQHQGSFCELRGTGEVFVSKQVTEESLQRGQRTLSARTRKVAPTSPVSAPPERVTLRQGYRDVLRDITGILLALLGAVVVFAFPYSLVAYYLDSLLAVLSVTLLMWLSFPFGKECSNILLQTIPDHIDVSKFSETLQQSFPDVLNVHHLHIWSLRPGKVVATVHMIFADKGVYQKNSEALTKFFKEQQISLVTLQPEFIVPQMATLPYCRCVDHLLDEAEDVCDDFAMSHLDIHYHLHADHHHYNHDENDEHVYYSENLHHHETDHGLPEEGIGHHHQHHQHHDVDGDAHDETTINSDPVRNKSGFVKQEPESHHSSHRGLDLDDTGVLPEPESVDGSRSHEPTLGEVSDNQTSVKNVSFDSISENSIVKIQPISEKGASKFDDVIHPRNAGVINGKRKSRNAKTKNNDHPKEEKHDHPKEEKSFVDSSIKSPDTIKDAELSPRNELKPKSKIKHLTKSIIKHQSKTSKVSGEDRKASTYSEDNLKDSPETSCSDLDSDEDLSHSYRRTASEKNLGLEDRTSLLQLCEQPFSSLKRSPHYSTK